MTCALRVDGRDLVAVGGEDGNIRLIDDATAQPLTALGGPGGPVRAP